MALIYRTQQLTEVYANSGYWADIQNAVDQAALTGGGDVRIPEGSFNFVNVGEDWTDAKVIIPAGVNLFGAPTERDANGQVIEWKTVLRLPWDVPSGLSWFKITGSGDPSKPLRFSDIKLVGYRSVDPNSTTELRGIIVECVMDFRIDHCYFEHTCGGIVVSGNLYGNTWAWAPCRGVIDHCFLVNPVSKVGTTLADCTVGYGVAVFRANGDLWEDDVSKVLGKYTDYTVFIEDCYFEKWRHCVAANSGGHYVIRHSTIKDDFGFGSLDAHGWFQTECDNPQHGRVANPTAVYNGTMWICGYEVIGNSGNICGAPLKSTNAESYFWITQVGTRAVEIYNCQIVNAIQSPWATFIRGGAGIAFNNTVGGGTYRDFMYSSNEAGPIGTKCWSKDWWIWNNTMLSDMTEIIKYDPLGNINEGVSYFRHAPHTFDYTPYPYPHPLVSGEIPPPSGPVTPYTESLEEGTYKITMSTQVQAGSDLYNFKQWEDSSINPVRTIDLTQDLALHAIYEKITRDLVISVNDTSMGTTDPAPGTHKITQGTNVQISAIPSTGYMFDHWELDGVNAGVTSPYSVTMDKDHTLLAVFVAKPPPPPGKRHLTISSTTGGTTTPAPGVWEYDQGSTAQVTATPNTGYNFKQWTLDNNPITPVQTTITVLMDADHTLVAEFEPVPPTPTLWTWPFLTWLRNLIRQRQGNNPA